jgi:ferredoxin
MSDPDDRGSSWTLLAGHGHVMVEIARDPRLGSGTSAPPLALPSAPSKAVCGTAPCSSTCRTATSLAPPRTGALYGHFGQGCVHTRIPFDLVTAEGIAKFRRFIERAADLVVSYGGSFSGEHGDGQSRGELLPKMFGDDLVRAFAQIKAIFDPGNLMNPGKVVAPYRIDENLRLGSAWTLRDYGTYFRYPDDDGRFERAVMRCVGVGKCRHSGGGVMCPSYMVTREEEHSTRGRSRLLFEMLEGHADSPVTAGWRSTEVRDALDLCLACKGCKKDCPVEVDMATMKAEFLAHHYAGRLAGAAAGQRADPGARPAGRAHRRGRDRPAPPDPAVRWPDAAGLGGRP